MYLGTQKKAETGTLRRRVSRGIKGDIRKSEHFQTPKDEKHSGFLLSIISRP